MEKKKRCPICKKEKEEEIVDVCNAGYEYIIDLIKKDHPDWLEKDGSCPNCIDYYKKL